MTETGGQEPAVAVIGGTGKEGLGLALRWASAGLRVVIGSRDAERAEAAAKEVVQRTSGNVSGLENAAAAAAADIAVVTTPFEGMDATAATCGEALRGKLVVSAVIPLKVEDGVFLCHTVAEGSATQRLQALLPESRVGAAFHTISHKHLQALDRELLEDVPVLADDDQDRRAIVRLCNALGARGVEAGPISLGGYLEGLTALVLNVNKLNRSTAGIRFAGLASS